MRWIYAVVIGCVAMSWNSAVFAQNSEIPPSGREGTVPLVEEGVSPEQAGQQMEQGRQLLQHTAMVQTAMQAAQDAAAPVSTRRGERPPSPPRQGPPIATGVNIGSFDPTRKDEWYVNRIPYGAGAEIPFRAAVRIGDHGPIQFVIAVTRLGTTDTLEIYVTAKPYSGDPNYYILSAPMPVAKGVYIVGIIPLDPKTGQPIGNLAHYGSVTVFGSARTGSDRPPRPSEIPVPLNRTGVGERS